MKLIIRPEEIVKRCLWDSYVYYILKGEGDLEKILRENEEFEIDEKDALVIGLLKIIETDNLIHKFNTQIVELLSNKSQSYENNFLINKKTLETTIKKFMANFPEYWEPTKNWVSNLNDLKEYVEIFNENLEELPVEKMTIQNFVIDSYHSSAVKKLLKFNY